MTKEQLINNIIEKLHLIMQKHSMYFSDSSHCKGFLDGIKFTIDVAKIISYEKYKQIYDMICRDYGATLKAVSFYNQMREEGKSEDEIIIVLLKVEIQVLDHILRDL